ncbi:MAG: hypothetical protein HQL52_14835 [Magnetococcales bacterium]|nr:hypothetical protein [Magnetococcales bacterium]
MVLQPHNGYPQKSVQPNHRPKTNLGAYKASPANRPPPRPDGAPPPFGDREVAVVSITVPLISVEEIKMNTLRIFMREVFGERIHRHTHRDLVIDMETKPVDEPKEKPPGITIKV